MENVPNSLNYVKNKYSAEELGLNPNLPDLIIPEKHELVASNYGSPQGRKRAIAGDYILPKITHNDTNFILTQEIMNALGAPLKITHNDTNFILTQEFLWLQNHIVLVNH